MPEAVPEVLPELRIIPVVRAVAAKRLLLAHRPGVVPLCRDDAPRTPAFRNAHGVLRRSLKPLKRAVSASSHAHHKPHTTSAHHDCSWRSAAGCVRLKKGASVTWGYLRGVAAVAERQPERVESALLGVRRHKPPASRPLRALCPELLDDCVVLRDVRVPLGLYPAPAAKVPAAGTQRDDTTAGPD